MPIRIKENKRKVDWFKRFRGDEKSNTYLEKATERLAAVLRTRRSVFNQVFGCFQHWYSLSVLSLAIETKVTYVDPVRTRITSTDCNPRPSNSKQIPYTTC